jgi:hypothetical protein
MFIDAGRGPALVEYAPWANLIVVASHPILRLFIAIQLTFAPLIIQKEYYSVLPALRK